MNRRILVVDDDVQILSAFERNLKLEFEVTTVTSGIQAIETIKSSPQFAVVVSDYHMPEMDGIEFLSIVKRISSDTVRIICTGFAELQTAIDAVNEGNIFRFLTKPIPPETFKNTIHQAIEQHRLITAEKELLEKTLKGNIKVLIDILSAINPIAFRQAERYRNIAKRIAEKIGYMKVWEIEIAAMLSQIGCVVIPSDILEKIHVGEALTDEERTLYNSHPKLGRDLLINIPRMEDIAEAIAYQFKRYDGSDGADSDKRGSNLPLISRILKIVNDFDAFLRAGKTTAEAIELMQRQAYCYDPNVLVALELELEGYGSGYVIKSIPFRSLKVGMVLAKAIKDEKGYVLVGKGHEITNILLMRLATSAKRRKIVEPIRILEFENK